MRVRRPHNPLDPRRDAPFVIDAEPVASRVDPIGSRTPRAGRTRKWLPVVVAVLLAFGLGAVSYRVLAGGALPFSVGPSAGTDGPCSAPTGMSSLKDQDLTDDQAPWKRDQDKVTIYFAAKDVSPEWRSDLEFGSAQWNRSPCLDTRVVDTCPTGANCVTVAAVNRGDDGNFDAKEKGGYTTGGHIDLLNSLTADQRKNVAVHEMGHAVGLRHRKTSHVLMNGDTYDDVFTPDSVDYQNLLLLYGRQAPTD